MPYLLSFLTRQAFLLNKNSRRALNKDLFLELEALFLVCRRDIWAQSIWGLRQAAP